MTTERTRAFDAVLFDMDGVLLESFDMWLAVLRDTAERFGFTPVDAKRLEGMFGQGIEEDERTLFPGLGTDAVRAAYDASCPSHVDRVRVNDEAAATLAALRAVGIRTGLVTNTQPSLAAAMLQVCGLGGCFDVLSPAVPQRRAKPEPDLVQFALERLGVAPGRALLVGDSAYDEEAARAAATAFVWYEMRSGASLRAAVEGALGGSFAGGDLRG